MEKEVEMVPIKYSQPYCHNKAMEPIFTYRDNSIGLYSQFQCQKCKHVDSRLVAVPRKDIEGEK